MSSNVESKSRYNLRKRKSVSETKTEKKQKPEKAEIADEWVKMTKKLTALKKELINNEKIDKMKYIAKEIMKIIDNNSNKKLDENKSSLIKVIKDICPEKILKIIKQKITDLEYVSFVAHGKHGSEFTCYIIWYTFDDHRVVYLKMIDHFGSHDGDTFIESSVDSWQFPADDIEPYINKWGTSNVSKENQEKFYDFISNYEDPGDVSTLPKFLVPLALLFVEDNYESFFV